MTLRTTTPEAPEPRGASRSGWLLPVLLLLFAGSGCAALIYEIVWFQLLEFVIGSSAVSLGLLLGVYMGGLCLGSIALPQFIRAARNPLRVYAALEALIGILGLLVLSAVPWVGRLYALNPGHGMSGLLLRGAVCALCLLPPTLLMGATLPAISRWIKTTPRGIARLGFLYGANIGGAVSGCLLAGFYLLRVHDMVTATCTAVAINAAVALAAFGLAAVIPAHPGIQVPTSQAQPGAPGASLVYLAIAVSGMCALGAEVVWTRLLSLLLGATVYTFSVILAVFLVGLGIGSGIGSLLARRMKRPRMALCGCQMLLTGAIAWTAFMLAKSLPFWPIDPSLSRSPWLSFQLDLVRCFWAVLPATILWGASFPLALAGVAARGQDPGRLVGRVYAANTVGAIAGALGVSLLLIGWIGTQRVQQTLIALSAVAALLVCAPARQATENDAPGRGAGETDVVPLEFSARTAAGFWSPSARAALALLVVGLGALLVWSVPRTPWQLIAFGRYLPTYNDDRRILYVGEGINASVAVTEMNDGERVFHISGKVEASTGAQDMRLQRMLGHLPALFHHHPRSVLVVGCGAGVTAGSFLTYPEVQKIVICEIEPLIPARVTPYFSAQNYNLLKDPRVQVIQDDARHFIFTTKEKFDIITSDPIHPWVKGAATLYTKEYFEACKQHLNPGGVVAQWVPLYESNADAVKSELATFFEVFTNGTLWSNDNSGEGYDTVVLGTAGDLNINVDELQRRLERNPAARQSLQDVGFHSVFALLSTYAGRASDLQPWLRRADINRDRNLRLQYLAGMASASYDQEAIYRAILAYRRYPEALFSGSTRNRLVMKDLLRPPNPGR